MTLSSPTKRLSRPSPTPERLEEWREKVAQGWTYKQITREYGPDHKTLKKYLGPAPRPANYTTEADIERWRGLLAEGWSLKEIAETEGKSKDTLYTHLPGQGWTAKQASELGSLVQRSNRKLKRARV